MIAIRRISGFLGATVKRHATWGTTNAAAVVSSRRSLMTPAMEPPPDVVESPTSLVLTEDDGFYPSSWHDSFAFRFPKRHGMMYSYFSLAEDTPNFETALEELKNDLSVEGANTVLVARGPWMAWMASFYLESLPLAGLVMVDPMQLDDRNGVNQFELQYEKLGLKDSLQYKLYREYSEHWDHWTLKLEPGSVPMMVMYTNDRPGYKRCAENTALRHGNVPVLKMPSTSQSHANDCIDEVANWINANVV